MKIHLSIIAILLLFSLTAGQDKPLASHWSGLIIDQSNACQVLEKFGQPTFDGPDTIVILKRKWVTKELQDKSWRVMRYTNIPEYREVRFLFNSAGTLEIIQYEPAVEKNASSFHNAYDRLPTKPYLLGLDESFSPKLFKRSMDMVFPPSYPGVYEIAGINVEVIILAGVKNPHPGAVIKPAKRIDNGERDYPGKRYEEAYPGTIYIVQVISRTLQNNEDAGLRKYLPVART